MTERDLPPDHFTADERERWYRQRALEDLELQRLLARPPLTPSDARRDAFERLRKALEAAPRPRYAQVETWYPIEAALEAWKLTLGPGEYHGYRVEQQALRAGSVQAFTASAEALVVDAVQRHRARHHYLLNKPAPRDRRPAAANTEQYRTRLHPEASPEPVDYDRRWPGVTSDDRRWKAPEALS